MLSIACFCRQVRPVSCSPGLLCSYACQYGTGQWHQPCLGISRGAVPLHGIYALLRALQLSHSQQSSASGALHHHRQLVLAFDRLAKLGGCLMI